MSDIVERLREGGNGEARKLLMTDIVSPKADREFLFTYRFGGAEWGTSVFAADPAEAKEKIKAMALARYDGECMARIAASVPAAGLLVRAICWWKNLRKEGKP